MQFNSNCEKCGNIMWSNFSKTSDGGKSTQHHCSKCGNCYESGLRYNALIKQYVKYIRFNP